MALHVYRKEKENPQSLLHRFTKAVRQSGLLLELRSKRFQQRPKSDLAKKRSALRKEEIKKEAKRLEKLGKPK